MSWKMDVTSGNNPKESEQMLFYQHVGSKSFFAIRCALFVLCLLGVFLGAGPMLVSGGAVAEASSSAHSGARMMTSSTGGVFLDDSSLSGQGSASSSPFERREGAEGAQEGQRQTKDEGASAANSPSLENSSASRGTPPVFGAQLFTGAFAQQGPTQFNPDYAIAVGDKIQVRLWGAFVLDSILTVDPKGNLFIPHVGPVSLQGIKNKDVQKVIHAAISKVFRANVSSYASLASAQPVRIFVSGNVKRPGLYHGTSMDSLLHYLDQAGGIDTERGTFLDIRVKRGEQVRARVNLYNFLLNGEIPQIQLADGDVVFVPPKMNSVTVTGLAEAPRHFEFTDERPFSVAELLTLSHPLPSATHLRITRNLGANSQVGYFPIGEASSVQIMNGDRVEFTADRRPATISIRVEGEHQSSQEFVLNTGTTLGEVLDRIEMTDRSQMEAIQLFRHSVRQRQKAMLETSLRSLEMATLTARSGTDEEALLRREEAALILKWVERAREIEPSGQVVLSKAEDRSGIVLEDGDIIRIPARDSLVLVSGEVLFPNAIAYSEKLGLRDYIENAGGYSQNANAQRIVIAHLDGSFERTEDTSGNWNLSSRGPDIQPGDQILVLPKIDVKSRQIAKDITEILYQIAVSAKVVFGL